MAAGIEIALVMKEEGSSGRREVVARSHVRSGTAILRTHKAESRMHARLRAGPVNYFSQLFTYSEMRYVLSLAHLSVFLAQLYIAREIIGVCGCTKKRKFTMVRFFGRETKLTIANPATLKSRG